MLHDFFVICNNIVFFGDDRENRWSGWRWKRHYPTDDDERSALASTWMLKGSAELSAASYLELARRPIAH